MSLEDLMGPVVFRYRARELTCQDIEVIRHTIALHASRGRSHISRVLCQLWNWVQPNGKLKEYAARDLLLRLEEQGYIKLPPRLRPKNNLKRKCFAQIPIFNQEPLCGFVGQYPGLKIALVDGDDYLWGFLLHHYHYLGLPRLVGEHLKYLVYLNGQVVACLAWASAAFKVKSRDDLIGWNAGTRHRRLHLVANNTRFLVLPWVRVKHLASKILACNCKRLSGDWYQRYQHPLLLAETFVDTARFAGTCYKAANWLYVGHTRGSAKRGNRYRRHGQVKAVYLYPLNRHFKKELAGDPR
jgi:hypothetical protein